MNFLGSLNQTYRHKVYTWKGKKFVLKKSWRQLWSEEITYQMNRESFTKKLLRKYDEANHS